MKTNFKFEDFQTQYPNLFKTYPRSGFDLPKGWEMIAHNLCEVLEHHIKYLPEEQKKEITVAQVKQKYGGLRWYMTAENEFISGAIELAEYTSLSVCEDCGKAGKQRDGGWIRTLCDFHHYVRKIIKFKRMLIDNIKSIFKR